MVNYGHTLRHAIESASGCSVGHRAPLADLLALMHVGKKARGTQLRFVVLEDIARPRILAAPDGNLIEAAYADVLRT